MLGPFCEVRIVRLVRDLVVPLNSGNPTWTQRYHCPDPGDPIKVSLFLRNPHLVGIKRLPNSGATNVPHASQTRASFALEVVQ